MTPQRVGDTPTMSTEAMSGHMNYDYSAPSVPSNYKTPGPGRLRVVDENADLKQPIIIQDISADSHGSWVNGVKTPNEVHGFPFKVREV